MGKIMFNDREYTGGDGGHIPITQAEYDALPMDVKLNGTVYMITDGDLPEVFPVGAVYISITNTNPSAFFGGVWEQIQDRFLLSAGSTYHAGDTGGEASHTLTVNEMPSHSHYSVNYTSGYSGGSQSGYSTLLAGSTSSSQVTAVKNTGGGQAHNNMPPYLVVYMWKRTA